MRKLIILLLSFFVTFWALAEAPSALDDILTKYLNPLTTGSPDDSEAQALTKKLQEALKKISPKDCQQWGVIHKGDQAVCYVNNGKVVGMTAGSHKTGLYTYEFGPTHYLKKFNYDREDFIAQKKFHPNGTLKSDMTQTATRFKQIDYSLSGQVTAIDIRDQKRIDKNGGKNQVSSPPPETNNLPKEYNYEGYDSMAQKGYNILKPHFDKFVKCDGDKAYFDQEGFDQTIEEECRKGGDSFLCAYAGVDASVYKFDPETQSVKRDYESYSEQLGWLQDGCDRGILWACSSLGNKMAMFAQEIKTHEDMVSTWDHSLDQGHMMEGHTCFIEELQESFGLDTDLNTFYLNLSKPYAEMSCDGNDMMGCFNLDNILRELGETDQANDLLWERCLSESPLSYSACLSLKSEAPELYSTLPLDKQIESDDWKNQICIECMKPDNTPSYDEVIDFHENNLSTDSFNYPFSIQTLAIAKACGESVKKIYNSKKEAVTEETWAMPVQWDSERWGSGVGNAGNAGESFSF